MQTSQCCRPATTVTDGNLLARAFFRTLAAVEEQVIAFAMFGEEFTKLADEAE